MKISKRYKVIAVVAIMAALALSILTYISYHQSSSDTLYSAQTPRLHASFEALSQATTDQCAYLGNYNAMMSYVNSQSNSSYFQGSCCSPMNYSHYVQQINGLKNYSDVPAIPQDPYNVSVVQVKLLLNYYNTIALNQSQNATFNQAATMTADHGWCCCQCWAWYAHAGLAKYLIKNYNYNSAQVVLVTNLEDCCGG